MRANGPGLIPQVLFVVVDAIAFENGAEFVAEVNLTVVFFLVVDVSGECVEVRFAEGKCAVASLPCKRELALRFHPLR